jgi:hypothetical protein
MSIGRILASAHYNACVRAGISMVGMNSESESGRWTFSIGKLSGT